MNGNQLDRLISEILQPKAEFEERKFLIDELNKNDKSTQDTKNRKRGGGGCLTRNEVGHAEIVPNLAKGVILANMAQFIHYLDTVYGLIEFFRNNPVEV